MTDTLPAQGPDRAFQDHVADGHLWLQRCADCGDHIFHPRILCPHCGSTHLDWTRASGLGTIHSRAAIVRRPKEGQTEPQKHCLVLVDLDEGPRMMSHLPDTPADAVTIGLRVRARVTGDEERAIVFDPVEPVEADT